jgi:hypothetical protein
VIFIQKGSSIFTVGMLTNDKTDISTKNEFIATTNQILSTFKFTK